MKWEGEKGQRTENLNSRARRRPGSAPRLGITGTGLKGVRGVHSFPVYILKRIQ